MKGLKEKDFIFFNEMAELLKLRKRIQEKMGNKKFLIGENGPELQYKKEKEKETSN